MKKLVSIIMALALILSLGIAVFAEQTEDTTTLIINGAAGRDFVGYKLLNATVSLKDGEHHPADCQGEHTEDCYNYAYTINGDEFRTILRAEVLANGRNELWDNGVKPTDPTKVTDEQILKYLEGQTKDDGDVYHTMRQVADRLYRAILAAGINPTKEGLNDPTQENYNKITYGYWLFADETTLDAGDYDANSLAIVNTVGMTNVTISPKTGLPTIEKKVKDIEDSEDNSILDNPWHDAADHDLNDAVPFKLTATLPANVLQYETYKIAFHDTLAEGLTLKPETIVVRMYDSKYKADVDTDLNDYVNNQTVLDQLANAFQVKTTGLTDGCTFEVVCENILAIDGVTANTTFVVYYEATLNANAKIGAQGNPNTVELEYSNDPYGTTTGKTNPDTVSVYTYQLTINKTDAQGHNLAGAGFTLYKKNVAGEYVAIGVEKGGEGSPLTTFTWEYLDDGDYKLEETTVPDGYNELAAIVFSITAVHTENSEHAPELTSLDGGVMGVGDATTGIITNTIVNHTGAVLPSTGAEGTMLLIVGGTMLIVLASVFMITRKKMSVYED